MKLLIDIPEHIYEHAKEMTEDSRDEGVAMRAIANGTPARCKGMNEAEKERLIKKNMLSMENRVRNVFNQGYEMGLKESRSEIPNTCGGAISRQSAILLASDLKQDLPDNERIADMVMAHNEGILEYQTQLSLLPSVTPQQRTGRWIPVSERLPEERGNYLVTTKNLCLDLVVISIASYSHNLYEVDEYDFAGKKRPGWYEYDGEWGYRMLDDVVAWMPLPEPYEEVEE